MSKDCRDCEYFDGYDCSDGTPICGADGGYERCPFNDYSRVVNNGIKIEIDPQFISDYIRHTIQNSVSSIVTETIGKEVSSLIKETYKDEILRKTEDAIEESVKSQIASFMAGDISVGGGWAEPSRTIPRERYMSEIIQEKLDEQLKGKAISEVAKRIVYDSVESFSKSLKKEINEAAKNYLDDSIRETLGEAVISILMESQPYIQLSEKVQNILPQHDTKNTD